MAWQKRARVGVAVFGVVCAVAVYTAIGTRETAIPATPPARLDPASILESEGAQVQQERGSQREFDVRSERQIAYRDGSTKLIGVEIRVRGRAGRDFVLTGQEAEAGQNQRELQLTGAVHLTASDGFELQAESASFNQDDGTVRAPGDVAFARGRMSGGAVGMAYDEATDVITLQDRAHVTMADEAGATTFSFSARTAVLDRAAHVLTLEGETTALRGAQAFAGDRAVARLTPGEDAVTFIELRGSAAVTGGGGAALDAMSARDIDLDYTDDGATLESVRLAGDATVALAGEADAPGRRISGDTLDLALDPEGSVTAAIGRGGVQLDLPASGGMSARVVRARALDAEGEPGRGLTQARFTGDVAYREDLERGAAPRVVTSRALRVSMDGNAITFAVFTGGVTFDDQGLRASGAEARYEPAAGTLRLTGVDAGGPPRVADGQVSIEAGTRIDITLADRRMDAVGAVKTTLRAAGASRLPGLLSGEAPANVNADALQYEGEAGTAVYRGNALLWQGQTAIRADRISIDRTTGDLVATGDARSTLALEAGLSIGQATEIRYDDARRVVAFESTRPAAAVGRRGAVGPAPPPARQSQLNGPQGQMTADRIEIVLGPDGGGTERIEAYTSVSARVGTRLATGDRLTYVAAEERYLMTGANAVPVKVVDACRETSGKTLTFYGTADRIVVDGNEEIRTRTTSGGPCTVTPAR